MCQQQQWQHAVVKKKSPWVTAFGAKSAGCSMSHRNVRKNSALKTCTEWILMVSWAVAAWSDCLPILNENFSHETASTQFASCLKLIFQEHYLTPTWEESFLCLGSLILRQLRDCVVHRASLLFHFLRHFFYLSCSIGWSSLLKEEAGYFHLAVLCCHMQRTEPFLLNTEKRHVINTYSTYCKQNSDEKCGCKQEVNIFLFFMMT